MIKANYDPIHQLLLLLALLQFTSSACMTFNLTQRSSWESEPRYSPPARFTKSRVDEYKDIEYDTI